METGKLRAQLSKKRSLLANHGLLGQLGEDCVHSSTVLPMLAIG